MANIDNELSTILNAGRGEDVRAAIVTAIKKIYNEREYPPTTLKVKNNGTKEGGPWNKVIVDVDGAVSKLDIDNCDTITQNGYYNLQTLKDLGLVKSPTCMGVDGFEVNVKQIPGEFGEINITENGVYDPLLDGYDGYSKVYVNVLGGEIKDYYTVRFFDGKSLLESKSVPRGTNATYTGSKQLSGTNFTGWNPSPVSVSRDMDCYAVYGDGALGTLIDKFASTISDPWAQICEKISSGTRPYPVGSTKTLELTGINGQTFILNMLLIGYNLDKDINGKYVSTWTNIQNAGTQGSANNIFPFFTLAGDSRTSQAAKCGGHTIWWGNSLMRAVFNADPSSIAYNTESGSDDLSYYNALAAQNMLLPDVIDRAAGTNLFKRIKQVIKYSFWYDYSGGTDYPKRDNPTYDKIWLPSSREMAFPIITNGNADPVYTPSKNMCTIGSVDSNGNQYGNPNISGETLIALNIGNSYNTRRTRDVVNNSGTGLNDRAANIMVVTNHSDSFTKFKTYTSETSTYSDFYSTHENQFLPISFCI